MARCPLDDYQVLSSYTFSEDFFLEIVIVENYPPLYRLSMGNPQKDNFHKAFY